MQEGGHAAKNKGAVTEWWKNAASAYIRVLHYATPLPTWPLVPAVSAAGRSPRPPHRTLCTSLCFCIAPPHCQPGRLPPRPHNPVLTVSAQSRTAQPQQASRPNQSRRRGQRLARPALPLPREQLAHEAGPLADQRRPLQWQRVRAAATGSTSPASLFIGPSLLRHVRIAPVPAHTASTSESMLRSGLQTSKLASANRIRSGRGQVQTACHAVACTNGTTMPGGASPVAESLTNDSTTGRIRARLPCGTSAAHMHAADSQRTGRSGRSDHRNPPACSAPCAPASA